MAAPLASTPTSTLNPPPPPIRKYRVVVRGRGIVVRWLWFFRRRREFDVPCFVEAPGGDSAGQSALMLVHAELKSAEGTIRLPQLEVAEITELASFDNCQVPRGSFVFRRAVTDPSRE